MKSEHEFMVSAHAWMRVAVGSEAGEVGPDTDLIGSGLLDSLLTISFLTFLEEERGGPLAMSADAGIVVEDFSTLRKAYALVSEPDPS